MKENGDATRLMRSGNDSRMHWKPKIAYHGAYLHFLKNVDAEYAYGQFATRGAQLRKIKKYRKRFVF